MSESRTLVTFESSAFNTSERKDYFINDCCYGDDVARWLIEQLRFVGIQTDAEPVQEDFGWVHGFRVGDTNYNFIIGFRPADGLNPAVWMGWVERKVGLLGYILGRSRAALELKAFAQSIQCFHLPLW